VRKALEGLPSVKNVQFNKGNRDVLTVQYEGDYPKGEYFSSTILDQVVAPGLRRVLDRTEH